MTPGIVHLPNEESSSRPAPRTLPPPPEVVIPIRSKQTNPTRPSNPAPPAPSSTVTEKSSAPVASASSSSPSSDAPIHPFSNVKENIYMPPHERNFATKAKDNQPAYHTQTPIHNPVLANDVYQRSMKTPFVTLTTEELLSISPDVRSKFREAITPKRIANDTVSANLLAEEEDTHIVVEDIYENYIKSLRPNETPERFVVAKESHSLRSISVQINDRTVIESVVDPGSQIIAMSEEVCHELGLAYDPSIRLNMESANGSIDQSLGLSRNVPCRIGSVTLYLQIHVIRAPAYDMLLGRPFDVLTESIVQNFANEDQTITIRDPNSRKTVTIPTFPRGPPKFFRTRPNNSEDFHYSRK